MMVQSHWLVRSVRPTALAALGAVAAVASAAAALGAVAAVDSAAAADKITFTTDFGLYGRHAYYFVAKDKGYYEEEGIEVDIVRSPGSTAAAKQVAQGTAQLGFADSFAVILGRANDGLPVKLVAMIYPNPPHAVYVLKDSGITKPKDLEGKTLADTAYSSVPKIFPIYAEEAGIDASKVKWIAVTSDALPGMLANEQVDGVGQYTVGEALLAGSAAPKEIVGLPYFEAGLDYYSNGIIASDEMIESNPDLVRRFVKATLAGLKDAIADPEEAGRIMHKFHRELDPDIVAAETAKVAELAVQPGEPLGTIEPERIQRTIDVVERAYDLKEKVEPSDVFASGFLPN